MKTTIDEFESKAEELKSRGKEQEETMKKATAAANKKNKKSNTSVNLSFCTKYQNTKILTKYINRFDTS